MISKAHIEDLMYGRKKALLCGGLLFFISILYGYAVKLRNALYALRLLRGKRLPVKVISVGNITLGGTGKTPAVIQIAGLLRAHNRRPVVISRGYGRQDESRVTIVSDGRGSLTGPIAGGDEPVLIGAKLSGVPVVAGSDRHGAGMYAVSKFHPDVVVLDDGFQHRRLQRDMDIVLVDATDPFGKGKLFPAGILREPLAALKRSHLVLITGVDRAENTAALKALLEQKTGARVFTSYFSPEDLVDTGMGESRPLSSLRGTTVLAFSGIARPASFTALLRSLGADVASELVYPDHYIYRRSDLAAIFQRAGDIKAALIVTTEKDAVKLKTFKPDGIWALRIDLRVNEEQEWERMILGKEQRA